MHFCDKIDNNMIGNVITKIPETGNIKESYVK